MIILIESASKNEERIMKKPLPPMPQWTKHLNRDSRVTRKEVAELFGMHINSVGKFMRLRVVSSETMRRYGLPKHYYLWSDVLEAYNNEIKEAEKLESLNKKV